MSDYTPTTDEVRRWYAEPQYERFDRRKRIVKQALARFDRWLAQHDAEVAATALREASSRINALPVDRGQTRMAAPMVSLERVLAILKETGR